MVNKKFEEIRIADVFEITPRNILNENSRLNILQFEDLSMSLRRFFVIDVNQSENRGAHAHSQADQIFYLLRGRIELKIDDGFDSKELLLQELGSAIYIPRGIWATQKYHAKSSLLVLTDTIYDEKEYIRNYGEFVERKKQG